MDILSKRLGKGEVNWKGIVIPRKKKALFPAPGVDFDLVDGKVAYRVKVDKQFRIRLSAWFRRHPTIKPSDMVVLSKTNGKMHIALSKNFSDGERGYLDWAIEVVQAIIEGDVQGIIRKRQNGFSVEIGKHIKETQIILDTDK